MALNRVGFPYIYAPRSPPEHEDFHFEWRNNLDYARDGHPIRCIFIASRRPLENPNLLTLYATPQTSAPTVPFRPAASAIWIDVGAHLGEKTFPIAQENPAVRVYAFEPNLPVALERT